MRRIGRWTSFTIVEIVPEKVEVDFIGWSGVYAVC